MQVPVVTEVSRLTAHPPGDALVVGTGQPRLRTVRPLPAAPAGGRRRCP
jgi:hypothetical protein